MHQDLQGWPTMLSQHLVNASRGLDYPATLCRRSSIEKYPGNWPVAGMRHGLMTKVQPSQQSRDVRLKLDQVLD